MQIVSIKSCFLGKIRKIFKLLSAEKFTQTAWLALKYMQMIRQKQEIQWILTMTDIWKRSYLGTFMKIWAMKETNYWKFYHNLS